MLSKDLDNTWHQVTAFKGDRMPDLSAITRGTRIEVKGRIRNQRYTDSTGVERSSTDILASSVTILDGADRQS